MAGIVYYADSAMILGRVIAFLRKEAGFTQTELAGLLGMGRAALAHLEKGRNAVPHYVRMRLVRVFVDERVIDDPWDMDWVLWESVEELEERNVRIRDRPLAASEHSIRPASVDGIVAWAYTELVKARPS
jgi:transcriptional regulator with XRE-family HTH domain